MVKDILKEARFTNGLTLIEVADALGLSKSGGRQYIHNFERGISNPSPKVLNAYSKLLQLDYENLAFLLIDEITEKNYGKLCKKYKV